MARERSNRSRNKRSLWPAGGIGSGQEGCGSGLRRAIQIMELLKEENQLGKRYLQRGGSYKGTMRYNWDCGRRETWGYGDLE